MDNITKKKVSRNCESTNFYDLQNGFQQQALTAEELYIQF